ncbi:hypothetical protein BH11PLA2_BH11PLA2_19870 [soil metagenome]
MSLRFETGIEFLPGYRLMERLGSGGFGEVWKCEAPGGIFKAVKIIHGDLRSQDDDMIRYAEQELKAMKRVKAVRHPYLLAIDRYDIIEGRLLIVMELADCNLWDRFRQCRLTGTPGIERNELLAWMLEAAEVLDLMNFEHQLMHLDIKPQNMFLQYNHVKVGDFGQVKDLEGIMASVTGGITPVYAAPETFDGMVTRYCDQYSLACVYQELLSGTRPFDGSSMQQLMMQHLTNPPNLAPSPFADRPALAKALAKKPEDRFANCTEFIKAMKAGTPLAVSAPPPELHNKTVPWNVPRSANDVSLIDTQGSSSGSSVISFATTGFTTTPLPDQLTDAQPSRTAPPDQQGHGPLRPALVIGVGATGLRLLQHFRKEVSDRFGSVSATPAVRSLFIDTDPETLTAAMADRSWEGLTALKPDEVYGARLNRSTHYMKPRATGRTLIEGWFDPKLLNLLPRAPLTQGLRVFGRLALCDHYRSLFQKIEADLDTILTPEALSDTMQGTGLTIGTNRPRVYLVASLAGGTGSGMVIDLAYILRNKLRKLGYEEADVVGLLFVPPDDPAADYSSLARSNVLAALTEFHHFSHTDTIFQTYYDDRHAFLRDPEPPFKDVYLLPATAGLAPPQTPLSATSPPRGSWSLGRSASLKTKEMNRSPLSGTTKSGAQRQMLRNLDEVSGTTQVRDSILAAADWLRLELFGPLGPTLRSVRARSAASSHVTVSSFGLVRYEWPRTEVVTRTARVVTGVMLNNWVSPDPGRAREVVPGWTAKLWESLGLDLDGFIERLRFAADQTVGTSAEELLIQTGESALPKGWLNRTPDAGQVGHVLIKFDQFIGHPVASANRPPTALEEAIRTTATDLATAAQAELASAVPRLIDDPNFRLAGAEEAARQLLADLNRMGGAMSTQADRLDEESLVLHELLSSHAHNTRSARGQGPQLAEALVTYPKLRFQSVLARRAARTYIALKDLLTTVKNDMANCRQRLQGIKTAVMAELETPVPDPSPHQVMPPGCLTIEDAAKRYLDVLTDDDLHQVETWVQAGIERTYGGLYQACLNTTETATGLLVVLKDQTRAYLNARLGDVDLAGMFEQKFGPVGGLVDAYRNAYEEATPELIGNGPWSKSAVNIFTAPTGDAGDPLRQAAFEAFPDPQAVAFAETPDETVIYREYPEVPLAALPHFGPLWQIAYDSAAESQPCSPHSRNDIPNWMGVDS